MIDRFRFRPLPAIAAACCTLLAACSDRHLPGENAAETPSDGQQRVVLYTSTDDAFAREVVASFEQQTGIRVQLVGDTEATKTTGLVTRLLAERDAPECDVWWSSEPMGTLLLQQSGVLEPGGMDGLTPDRWPDELVGENQDWIGFAERGRVIAYAPGRVDSPPTTLGELVTPEWADRVGMARPQFGTTRGHMALLCARWGTAGFEAWLQALQANGLRLYDGNARVVRAIHEGEIDAGLTDTDDVWVAIANGWDIAMTYETTDTPDQTNTDTPNLFPSPGPTTIPNTVALVAGAPNPEAARRLAAYLVSPAVERLLAESDSRNIPVDPELRRAFSGLTPPDSPGRPRYSDAHGVVETAMDLCERVLISP